MDGYMDDEVEALYAQRRMRMPQRAEVRAVLAREQLADVPSA